MDCMLHTPRLCIDTRVSPLWGQSGHEVDEFVDELAAYHGDEESPWVNRHRTVLLSNKGQVSPGPWKRYDTRIPPTGWLVPFAWERRFVRRAPVTFMHRFRPFGFAAEKLSKPTLTTWLPSHRVPLHSKVRGHSQEQYVVPSHADKTWFLDHSVGVKESMVHVVQPGPRRFLYFNEVPRQEKPRTMLIVGDVRGSSVRLIKAAENWKAAATGREILFLSQNDLKTTGPKPWVTLLGRAEMLVYDVQRPFDSGMLAWEAILTGVPVLFPEHHGVLSGWDSECPWSLETFIENPSAMSSPEFWLAARKRLETLPKPEPLHLVRDYAAIYRKVFG